MEATSTLAYYECLGIETRLDPNLDDLSRRFYKLSREWHPDRFAARGAAAQREAVEKTALLNDAFRTLKDPVRRSEYVLGHHGLDAGEQRTKDVPPELLEEVLEMNLALEEIRSGDESARGQLETAQRNFTAMLSESDAALASLFRAWDAGGGRETLERIRGALNRRKYIDNLVRTVNQALAPAE